MARSLRWTFLLGFAGLAAAGCGPSTGTVSGKVTFEGKDLPMGSINFVPEKGNAKTGAIQDGKYTVDEVPLGEAKVTITVPMAVAGGGPFSKGGPPAGKGIVPKDVQVPQGFDPSKANMASSVKIPQQYADGSTTPLKYTVVSGKQTKDFDLK